MYSRIIVGALFTLLVSCTPAPNPAQPVSTPAFIWHVQIEPEVDYLRPVFNLCAQQNPEIGILLVDRLSTSTVPADFYFRWGAPENIQGYAVVLGSDHLAIIVHPSNPHKGLARDDLRSIYQNVLTDWNDLDPALSFSGQIEVWRYQPEQSIQRIFEQLLNTPLLRNPFAMLAPDPEAMRQAVSQNPDAIGFLPARWLNTSVKPLMLSDVTAEALSQPVLAISSSEPDSLQQSWLHCVQDILERTKPE